MVMKGPAASAKRFLDIEAALWWAYRDELPKRQHGGRYDSRDLTAASMSRLGGAAADDERPCDHHEPGFPEALGEPHPDAITIEAAVKGLEAWQGHGFGPDPTAAGLMHGMEHMAIDHVQTGMEAVAMMAGLIAVHARAGTRPRWSRKLPEPFPDNGPNGKPKVLIDETFVERVDRKGVYYEPTRNPEPGAITFIKAVPSPPIRAGLYRQGAYCPLLYRPKPAGIVAERAEYAAWRMGLEILAGELEGRLSAIAVLTPAAPWRPWCFDPFDKRSGGSAGEGEQHGWVPELFRGQRDEPHRRVTREQEAAKRRAALRRSLQPRTEQARPVTRAPAKRDNGTNGA